MDGQAKNRNVAHVDKTHQKCKNRRNLSKSTALLVMAYEKWLSAERWRRSGRTSWQTDRQTYRWHWQQYPSVWGGHISVDQVSPAIKTVNTRPCSSYIIHACVGENTLSWWRDQMETLSALLALCEWSHRSPGDSPHKGQWVGDLVFSLICAWTYGWANKNRDAGDLRHHRAHYDVFVMSQPLSIKPI